MIRRLFVFFLLTLGIIQSLAAGELSGDAQRMKERLVALSQGAGAVADFRMELLGGGAMTGAKMGIYTIADGKIISQEWDAPGSPEKRDERVVTEDEIRKLVRELVEKQYWTFQGTAFIPDAEEFMFRIHYKNLQPVEYRCQAREYQPSQPLSAIRSVLLTFVSGSTLRDD